MRTLAKLGLRRRWLALFAFDWTAARSWTSALAEQLYTRFGLRTESGYAKLMRR